MPAGDWNTWLILAGRGFGKTRTGAETITQLHQTGAIRKSAIIGATLNDVRKIMLEEESGILQCAPPWFFPKWESSNRRLLWPDGSITYAYTSEEPERLRGPQHDFAWCDEFASWNRIRQTWDNLQFGLRLGDNPRVLITTTPKPLVILKEILKDITTTVTRGHTFDNAANLARKFLAIMEEKYSGTRLGRQELEGMILDDIEGAFWTREMLEACRLEEAPEMERILIALDPAGSKHKKSNKTGIVAVGRAHASGTPAHGYAMADWSGRYSPNEWASKAIKLYKRLKADAIVAETNFGGEMVKNTIRNLDANVRVIEVNARQGKRARMEPVVSLYEQGRIHHLRNFPGTIVKNDWNEMESQQCRYTEKGLIKDDENEDASTSPDNLDAACWGFTELFQLSGAEIQLFTA